MGVKSDPGAATDTEDSPPGSLDGILTRGGGWGWGKGAGNEVQGIGQIPRNIRASQENPEGRWSSLSHQNVPGLKGTMGAGKGV